MQGKGACHALGPCSLLSPFDKYRASLSRHIFLLEGDKCHTRMVPCFTSIPCHITMYLGGNERSACNVAHSGATTPSMQVVFSYFWTTITFT